MKSVTLRARYRPSPGNHLHLTVRFGDAQFGSSRVMLDEELVRIGDIDHLDLGESVDVRGKRLSIVSIVSDVSPHSQRLLAGYELSGGSEPLNLSLERLAADDGAAERFLVDVSIV